MKWAMLLSLLSITAAAQTVEVYSEFAQINQAGEVTAREEPREILSPAVARNAFSSFQVVVRAPQGTKFLMYVGQNPDNAVKVTFYRRTGNKLEPVELPYTGEGTQILWMDLWIDANARVRRVKVEPQVGIHGDWVIYPMEVRVSDPVVPEATPTTSGMQPFDAMHAVLCGGSNSGASSAPLTAASLHARNARQDVALAMKSSEPVRQELTKMLGGCGAKEPADPEAYLKVRDVFFTALWKRMR
jgi:hypothetical protein